MFALKWYYDQKSPHIFFLHFESMIYKCLPCQILGHDFDEKSEFLDYERSIKLPAITQLKNGRVQKRVGSRQDVTSSNQDNLNKRGYLSVQMRSAMVMFYPSSCVFCLRSPCKRLCRQVVALFDWMTSHPPSTQLSLFN